MEAFRLAGQTYRPMAPDEQGRFRSEQLGASLGLWRGVYSDQEADWVRLFRSDGSLMPTKAEAARQQVKLARQRAEAAEAELARLRALLDERGKG